MKLILGKDGFIGSNIKGDLKLGRKDVNLLNTDEVLRIFEKYQPTTLINCAGMHGSFISLQESEQSDFLFDNLQIDINILSAAKKLRIPNLLLLSSITSFSPQSFISPNVDERSSNSGDVDIRFFGYSTSKRIQPQLVKSIRQDHNLNYKSCFLGNIYGPNDKFSQSGTAIASILYRIMTAKKQGLKKIKFFGDGSMKRNWTYVEDLNSCFDMLIEKSEVVDPLIISSMEIHDLKSVANLAKQLLEYEGELVFDPVENVRREDKTVSNSKFIEEVGVFDFTDLKQGMMKTIDWLLNTD